MSQKRPSLEERIDTLEKKLASLDVKDQPSNESSPRMSKMFQELGVAFVFYLMSDRLSKNPTSNELDSFIEMMYSEMEHKIDRSQITPDFRNKFAEVCMKMTHSMMEGAMKEAKIKD